MNLDIRPTVREVDISIWSSVHLCFGLEYGHYWTQVSHFLSVGFSVSANITPAASHVTVAVQASTRSHGVLQLLTAQMNVSVSVDVQWFIQGVNKAILRYYPLCQLLELQSAEWTEVSSWLWYSGPVVYVLIWYCREPVQFRGHSWCLFDVQPIAELMTTTLFPRSHLP